MRRISMFARPSVISDQDSGSGSETKLRRRKSSMQRRKSSVFAKEKEEDKPKQKLIMEEQAEEGMVSCGALLSPEASI